jgi:hypothetical protein
LFGVAAKHPPLKLILAFDFHVRHNYGKHLFVNIDSRYSIRHSFLLAGSGERAAATLIRVTGYRRSHREDNDAQLFAQSRTLRIRQAYGLNLSIVVSTSPLRAVAILPRVIFMRFRGPQALNDKA